jgi:DNA-binding winged helix-turn-helix (wHTH) protein
MGAGFPAFLPRAWLANAARLAHEGSCPQAPSQSVFSDVWARVPRSADPDGEPPFRSCQGELKGFLLGPRSEREVHRPSGSRRFARRAGRPYRRDVSPAARPRYLFSDFVLSPARRLLLRGPREVPLIPRYFDLLLLLVERRERAVHRREILDAVWSDVVVSDGALNQAVRTLRRALDDDPREPMFIRTVSRHGYRFVFSGVVEQADEESLPRGAGERAQPSTSEEGADPLAAALERLQAPGPLDGEERREAAEALHALGTAEALARLDRSGGSARARALLRDTRWDVAGAGPVPLLGQPDMATTMGWLSWLRLRRAVRVASGRWMGAAAGGALSGLGAGIAGGLLLRLGPGSRAADSVPAVLGLLGTAVGGLGAAGVGAGLAAAEVLARSFRGVALVVLGALGGGAVGAGAHLLALWTIQGLFGGDLSPTAGGFEGLVLGAACGLGYALTTRRAEGGMAAPRGRSRALAVLGTGLGGAAAAVALAATGSHLGAMSLEFLAHAFPGSQVGLAPLSRLLGEDSPGMVTRVVISGGEGLLFGGGLALGLTRRPRSAAS